MKAFVVILAMAGVLSACAPTYSLVQPTPTRIESLELRPGKAWNKASRSSREDRADSETWTKDGLLLDRLFIVAGVPDGEPMIKSRAKDAALPPFRAHMLPNEIEELVESTIVKLYGEGNSAVETRNLRPHRFDEQRGILFDIEARVTESPNYKGLVGAFVADDELYVIMYIAVETYYYDKHIAEAESVIKGARLAYGS